MLHLYYMAKEKYYKVFDDVALESSTGVSSAHAALTGIRGPVRTSITDCDTFVAVFPKSVHHLVSYTNTDDVYQTHPELFI